MADPQVAGYIRFDHRQAIHPPSTLLKHVTQGRLEASKGIKNKALGASPLQVGPSRMAGAHQLDARQPSRPLKRPTKEASETMSLKSPLSTSNTKEAQVNDLLKPTLSTLLFPVSANTNQKEI
jgi:hypothetical protein